MFQVEPILWLQGHASPGLTLVMWAISIFGYMPACVAIALVLAFGWRLRPTLGVILALIVAAILMYALKEGLALPRPTDVDARVMLPWNGPPAPVVLRGGARSFWSPPPAWTVAVLAAVLLMPRLDEPASVARGLRRIFPLAAAAGLLLVLTPIVPVLPAAHVGQLAGFTGACALVFLGGFPADAGTVLQRSGRVLIAMLLYAGVSAALARVFIVAGWENVRAATALAAAMATGATFLGGVAIARRLRWYGPAVG